MKFLSQIAVVLFFLGIIYCWNRFVIAKMVRYVVHVNKKKNPNKLDQQPLKFLIENEEKVILYGQGFYWVGGIVMILILVSTGQ